MKIYKNYDLTSLNTFGVSARAKFFVEVRSEGELQEVLNVPEFQENPRLFLGGGSNILMTADWDGIVVQNKLKGIEIVKDGGENVWVRAVGGEAWHDLVIFAVERGLWGIENLSSIPGSVGAAPVQNIGAYGAELKDVLESVEVYEVDLPAGGGQKKIFRGSEYAAGYRESIFKKFPGKYFITAVTLKLTRNGKPNLSYKGLREYVERNKIPTIDPKRISEAVTEIRKEKLPDPSVIANAGSFFKNVYVDATLLQKLLKQYPDMPYFKDARGTKISSAWLIEQCAPEKNGVSWKGYRLDGAGVYEKHALVLVNHGGATGKEIKGLAERIAESVRHKFGVELIPEVNLI